MDRMLAQFEDVVSVQTAASGAHAWTAREPGSGRCVLIKCRDHDDGKTRATLALSLSHPRSVRTRRWLRDGDRFYVIRDWVTGQNLHGALSDLAQRAFDRLHARLLPLLETLDDAHSAGLTHGALTAENVLFDARFPDFALLSDWGTAAPAPDLPPHVDLSGLCALYKEFLPTRPVDDEAGTAARQRLLRNLTDTQETSRTSEELRYKLDAIARMAALLGFNADELETTRIRQGARLVCSVSPPTATLTPGGGASVLLAVDNEGDTPLHIEAMASDTVWLNLPGGFSSVDIPPGTGGDLVWTVSGARLTPGSYRANLTIQSNDGLTTPAPLSGTSWSEKNIAVPVLVQASSPPPAIPLTDDLEKTALFSADIHTQGSGHETLGHHPGIACVQEPDPGLVRYGQNGVLHLGVQNTGPTRLRVDRVQARPAWLVYPGEFRPLWIEPGETQFLGFSAQAGGLAGGDYKAVVTFTTSTLTETLLGPKPVWRDMTCEVRVRIVRGGGDPLPEGVGRTGCLPLLLLASALVSAAALLGARLLQESV